MTRLFASARRFRPNLRRLALLAAGAVVSAAVVACNGDADQPTAEPASGLPTPTLVVRGRMGGEMDDVPRRTSPVALGSPEYAVQGFLWWRPEVAERDLLIAKDMGFTWVKQMFSWRDIETEKGKFDWSKADHIVRKAIEYQDIHLLIRLDFQPEWARSGCSDQGPPNDPQDYFCLLYTSPSPRD